MYIGETAMMKYPDDVEAAMDDFILAHPNADLRAVIRAFEQAMAESMREGASYSKSLAPMTAHDDRR
jgi:hypothetical protein